MNRRSTNTVLCDSYLMGDFMAKLRYETIILVYNIELSCI